MSEQVLIIDIETRPNESLKSLWIKTHQKEIREWHEQNRVSFLKGTSLNEFEDWITKQMATNTDFCEIALICIKQLGGECRVIEDIRKLGEPTWANLLHQMSFVTFNGKTFDLPILIKQGLKLGLDLPYKRLANACKKWGYADRHIDLMETLAFGGRWATLNTYLQVYLGIKKETDGEEFFKTATLDDLKKHCEEDIVYTEKLYRFFEKIL